MGVCRMVALGAEPVVVLLTVAAGMTAYTRQQFFETTICQQLNQTEDCSKIDRSDPSFKTTIDDTEDLLSYLQFIELFLPLIVTCIAGPLSDKYGRKWFLLGNQIGYTLRPLGYLLLSILPTATTTIPSWMLALPSVPTSIAGMDALAFNLVYSYAGDLSHGASNRAASFRFLIIETL